MLKELKSESLDWEHKAGCIEQHDFTQLVSVTLTRILAS